MRKAACMFQYVILMSALLLAQNAHAADTLTLGGNGGTADWSRTCPSGKRVIGINVRFDKDAANIYSPIKRIALLCRGVTSNGTWASGSSEWTSLTSSDHPLSGGYGEIASCSNDRFVAGFNVKSKWITTVSGPQLVIMTIALACHKITANQAFVGTPQTSNGVTAGEGWSFSGSYQYCQTGGISRGAKGRRGWYLDSIALTCTDPSG